jgi:hypothetical protein
VADRAVTNARAGLSGTLLYGINRTLKAVQYKYYSMIMTRCTTAWLSSNCTQTNSLKMKFMLVVFITANMLMMASSSFKAHDFFTDSISAHEGRRMQASCSDDDNCPTRTQFCGIDNQCHDFSCQAWFQKGGWNVESIGNTTLACDDYSNGDQDGKYAVVYGCSGYTGAIPEGEGYGKAFDQKCSATIGMQLFECYDLKPDTDFSSFLIRVDSAAPLTCTNRTDGSGYSATFIYQIITGSESPTTSNFVFTGPDPTVTFNESLTPFTMTAITTNLTLAPTQNPTEGPINPPTSGVPIIGSSFATAALVGLVAFLI